MLSASDYKEFFSNHGSGVAVVTIFGENREPLGLTVSSLSSLSLEPPLATFNLSQLSRTFSSIAIGSIAAVHILSEGNKAVALEMSGRSGEKFKSGAWDLTGPAPICGSVSNVLLAEVDNIHLSHASAIIVLRLEGLVSIDPSPKGPLIYFKRGFL